MRGRLFRFPLRLGIPVLGLGAALACLAWSSSWDRMPPVPAPAPAPRGADGGSREVAVRTPSAAFDVSPALPARTPRAALDPGTEAAGEPATEREFYELFTSLQATELESRAGEILEQPGPDCRRVALLRAVYDRHTSNAPELFVQAIRNLPAQATAVGESVPSFAVRFLGDKAGRDPGARRALEIAAFESHPPVSPGLRRRAAVSLGATASATELSRLSLWLAGESDHLVVEGALAALRRNPNEAAAAALLSAFGKPLHTQDQASSREG